MTKRKAGKTGSTHAKHVKKLDTCSSAEVWKTSGLGALENGSGSSAIIESLKRFDVSNPILQSFQADNARRFRLSIVDKDGARKSWKLEAGRSVVEVEALYSLLSDFGVVAVTSALLLQATLREALQASIVLDNIAALEAGLAALPAGSVLEYEALKQHETDAKAPSRIVIDAEALKLIKLVATACAARYEYTEAALVTRSRTKRAHATSAIIFEEDGLEAQQGVMSKRQREAAMKL